MTEDKDYEYVDVGYGRKMKIPHAMFLIGILLVIILIVFGGLTEDVDLQMVLIIASVVFIGGSILWGTRAKLKAVVISFFMLLAIYFMMGVIVEALGLSEPFSYGFMTFIIIFAFVFWTSLDNKITWDDAGKCLLFIIITYVANASGWLAQTNDVVATAIEGLRILGA